MLDWIAKLWNSDSLSPHGICLLWRPELIWTHAISDALIGLSYLSISIFLATLLFKRPDIKFGWVVWCFALFILACGGTHFMSIVTLWSPDYGLEALVKVITAVASVATAVLLWPMLPQAVAWPSPEQLALANTALQSSVAERDQALQKLRTEMAERERVEDILRRSMKLEALGQLTGGLAHDFNNLLAIITMNLSRMGKQVGDAMAPEVTRALSHASQAADRAAGITQRMLAFSRHNAVVTAPTDIGAALREMEPLLRDAVGLQRNLHLDIDHELPEIMLDRSQLQDAVLNLVLNARDATAEGGTITICAGLDKEDRSVMTLEVSDTGAGMSPEVVSKAFDPFFTTKAVGKGSGLGLSQVFGFARQLGGNASISSVPNSGTTISLTLPARS